MDGVVHEESWEGEENMDDALYPDDNIWPNDDIDDAMAGDDGLFSMPGEFLNYTVREYNALVGFYRYTGRGKWANKDLWLSDSSVCDWCGVGCNEDQSVTSLELNQNSIVGSFFDIGSLFLRQLANLTMLDLENNALSGTIPTEIGRLVRLTHLKLGNNVLTGFIPTSLSQLPQLESLELQGN